MTPPGFQLFTSLRFDEKLLKVPQNRVFGSPSPWYMLIYHRDRVQQAAEHFQWSKAATTISGDQGLQDLVAKMEGLIDKTKGPLRVKVLLSHDGDISVESGSVADVPLSNLFPVRLPPPESFKEEPAKVSTLTGGHLTVSNQNLLLGTPEKPITWTIVPDTMPTTKSSYTTYKTTSRDMYDTARSRVSIKAMTEPKEVLIFSDQASELMEGSLTTPYFWRNGKWTTPPTSCGGQIGTTRRWLLNQGLCIEGVVQLDSLINGEECWISNGVRGLNWGLVEL